MTERHVALVLTRGEIQEITGLWQHSAQARALKRLGIPFDRRSTDGSLIVGREAAQQALCRSARPAAPVASPESEPVWSVH